MQAEVAQLRRKLDAQGDGFTTQLDDLRRENMRLSSENGRLQHTITGVRQHGLASQSAFCQLWLLGHWVVLIVTDEAAAGISRSYGGARPVV